MSKFPDNPTQFQIYTEDSTKKEWQWDGRKWNFLDKAFYQARGPQGGIGPQGDTGATGASGSIGQTGKVGDKGEDGSAGQDGPSGPKGDRGEPGLRGGAYCRQVIEAPASGSLRGTLYINAWNEVFVAIG